MRREVEELINKLEEIGINPTNCEELPVTYSDDDQLMVNKAYQEYRRIPYVEKDTRNIYYEKYQELNAIAIDNAIKSHGLFKLELVEQVGGEGEGDHYHIIINVNDIFLKTDARYASHYGVDDYSSFYEVVEKEVTTTVFSRV